MRGASNVEKSATDFKSIQRGQVKETLIALFTLVAIGLSLFLRFGVQGGAEIYGLPIYQLPLLAALLFGGVPLVFDLFIKLIHAEFGSDLLAGISIVTSVLLSEYLAGALV